MSYSIEQIDTKTAPEEKLRALHHLYAEADAERIPGDLEMPWEQRLADWRFLGEYNDIPRWIAWDGETAIGASVAYIHLTQDLDNCWSWAFVTADRRRQGIGRALLSEAVAFARDAGRKRFGLGVPEESEFSDLPVKVGLKPVYDERISHLRTSELDHSLMNSWIERAAERAQDYELLFLPMPVPQEHREQMLAVMEVMNTAPLEDLEEDPFHWTDELLSEIEQREEAKGRVIHICVARHIPSGDFVGYTSIVFQSFHPKKAHQWDTGVDPAHRNLGLGRWLKAAMIEDFLARHPEVELIETENADSNEPMLNINVAMGFKPALAEIIYQGQTETVAEHLGL